MGYTALSIHNGRARVHMNRFRVCVKVPRNRADVAMIGTNLLYNMSKYMAASTARADYGDYNWNDWPTLKFRGVARVRPFIVMVPPTIPGVPLPIPVPARVRDWMAPDMHTDSVGVVAKHGSGFTVQTLKREYEDSDDVTLRAAIVAAVTGGVLAFPLAAPLAPVIAKVLGDVAVYYNQHHFLAGRRGFRFDWGEHFGYGRGADRCVFETVAIERFSSVVFEKSVIAMGDVASLVRAVWVQMIERFCRHHGLEIIRGERAARGWSKVGDVHCLQIDVDESVAAIEGSDPYSTMQAEHQQILEPR